ncbi:MAG: hypothetical protein V1744_06020 [Candidatus Altiarchaeota archaeon]
MDVYFDDFYGKYSLRQQYVEMFALAALGFLLPFTVGHPQILVGVLVNAFIIRAALTLPEHKALLVVFTPVLGALARGLLFGPFTLFLVYMVPFIWAGNYILMKAFRVRGNYFLRLGVGSVAKTGLLFGSAYALYSTGLLPALMLSAMGVMQLTTAIAGGILAYGELKAERHLIG